MGAMTMIHRLVFLGLLAYAALREDLVNFIVTVVVWAGLEFFPKVLLVVVFVLGIVALAGMLLIR